MMFAIKNKFLVIPLALALAGCVTAVPTTPIGLYNYENTIIRSSVVPQGDLINRQAVAWGLNPVTPLIPGFDNNGLLLASWTPSTAPNAPTFVIAHGGGGFGATEFVLGHDLRERTGANILIIDSIWSRGRFSNGGDSVPSSGRTLSSNARMFDLSAAGRWLATKGVNANKTYAVGLSQGGWGVLRAFTNDPMITELIKPYYAGGVALYPPCEEPGTPHTERNTFEFHKLGPYHSRVLLITAGLDTLTPVSHCSKSTVRTTTRWLHWEDATHAFHQQIGPGSGFRRTEDGLCKTMINIFGAHRFCYNERRAKQMLNEILQFSVGR